MAYELKLVFLSILIFIKWPGDITVFLPFLALGWSYVSFFFRIFPLD